MTLAVEKIHEDIRPEKLLRFERVIPISAKMYQEVDKVKEEIRDVIDALDRRNDEDIDAKVNEKLRKRLMEHGPKMV